MRINGEWYACDDGVLRPIIRGEIQNAAGDWEPALLLIDTGADCTVFSAALFSVLGFVADKGKRRLGGVGGPSDSIDVRTKIRLLRDDKVHVTFQGDFNAMTHLEMLDISVLGRDVLNLFAVIVDGEKGVVSLVRPPHHYKIERT